MPIAQVAQDGNLQGLNYQVSIGAPLDGSDGEP
jgi:hypothetical protein